MRILVVDDSNTSRMVLEAILRSSDYKDIVMADSGLGALEKLEQSLVLSVTQPESTSSESPSTPREPAYETNIDLILMDINMPQMDGIETVSRIKGDARFKDIPIIMVTVSDDKESLERAFDAGALDYVHKPVNKIEMLARVSTVLKFKEEMDRRMANELGLIELTENLARAYKELEELNDNLEQRVLDRTAELEQAYADLKKIDSLKTAFMSNVSHELRTPLTTVLGFASVMRKKMEKVIFPELKEPGSVPSGIVAKTMGQVAQNLDIMLKDATWLMGRIEDVLDITSMEQGEMGWSDESVDIVDLIGKTAEENRSLVEDKGLVLSLDIEKELHPVVGDSARLVQVLGNLLSNSIKFTDQGEISIKARNQDDHVLVSVHDTGVGFPEEEYDSVFEKFRQVGDPLTGKPKGPGLGIPICSQIIQRHGGKFWAESEPGQGSAFYFTLPAAT